jgi:hypothetical protein
MLERPVLHLQHHEVVNPPAPIFARLLGRLG